MEWTSKNCEVKLVYEGKIITIPIYVNGGETYLMNFISQHQRVPKLQLFCSVK